LIGLVGLLGAAFLLSHRAQDTSDQTLRHG
jgi:hypothetical protein